MAAGASVMKAGPLAASPTPAISGESILFTGRVSSRAVRRVELQRHQTGRWVTVATSRTTKTGSFRLRSRVRTTSIYRVRAPRSRLHGRVLAVVITPSRHVQVQAQTATLRTPASATEGQSITVTITATPVRAGRAVVVQEQDTNGNWVDLASGVEDMTGTASITLARNVPGEWQLRAVARGANGAASCATATTSWLPSGALTQIGTTDLTSTSSYNGAYAAQPDQLYYYTDSAGNLNIVSQHPSANTLSIETVNPSTLKRIGDTRSISLAGWTDWGDFYAGPGGDFYVLVGRENPNEDDTLDVVAVRRYDSNWNLLGTAYVQGSATQGGVKGIYTPFDASAPHMVLIGNRLVVHMARLIYAIAGIHHQVNLTFEVNVDTMQATTFDQLGGAAYSSHSFQQLVAMNGSDLVMIDHGDAYPRAIQLGVIAGYPTQRQVTTFDLFDFNGQVGDNFTGATVNALVSGPSGVVILGDSIPQPDAPNGPLGSDVEHHNLYEISADPATGAHATQWLTTFDPNGADDALEPRVVQVGPDRYAVLFSVQNGSGYRMEYRLIDSAGTVLATASFPGLLFCAISAPIVIDSKVYWAGIDPTSQDNSPPEFLFALDVSNPTSPTLLGGSSSS